MVGIPCVEVVELFRLVYAHTHRSCAGSAQKAPEFMAMNPMHCIPTLEDGDFQMW